MSSTPSARNTVSGFAAEMTPATVQPAGLAPVQMLAVALLQGCVYLPAETTAYNADCGSYERRITLEAYQVGSLIGCHDEGCVTGLVVAGVVSAASAVISGSVVVVGKAVRWLEKPAHCPNPAPNPGKPVLPATD